MFPVVTTEENHIQLPASERTKEEDKVLLSNISAAHDDWADHLVVVIFDSSAAAFGVNHGSSPSELCMNIIESIYLSCDTLNVTLVALWVPREQNTFSDMLTHICVHNRTAEFEGEFAL